MEQIATIEPTLPTLPAAVGPSPGTTVPALLAPESVVWLAQARAWRVMAAKATVGTAHELEAVGALRVAVSKGNKAIDEARLANTAPYRIVTETINAFWKTALDDCKLAVADFDKAIKAYEAGVLAELAAQRVIELARRQAEIDRQIEEAARLEAAGNIDAAEDAVAVAVATERVANAAARAEPTVAFKMPAGMSRRVNWSAVVIDKRTVIEAWLKGEIPDDVVIVDQSRIDRAARDLKSTLSWPGIVVKSEGGLAG